MTYEGARHYPISPSSDVGLKVVVDLAPGLRFLDPRDAENLLGPLLGRDGCHNAAQIRNQVVKTVAVVELPAHFDLPGAGGPHASDNLAVLGAEDARINELFGERFSSNFCIGRCLVQ
jgi:hypothetical protein